MSQGNSLNHPKMNQDLFKVLPSEIVIDILLRLPVQSVIRCMCVRKSWLHLVETDEFVKFHLSKSVPALIRRECNNQSKFYNFLEFEDGFNVKNHFVHQKIVTKFSTNLGWIQGSADGLLLCKTDANPTALYVCNPITNKYINLHYPQEFQDPCDRVTWGFGSSKMTSQYKVVRIVHGRISTREEQKTFEVECYVYTLGTDLWRRCASCALLQYNVNQSTTVFANGNLHWLVCDLDGCLSILRFDLETEHFSTWSPPLHWNENFKSLYTLNIFVWVDCLGICDNSLDDEIVIWLMKEYGVERSWTKEIVISNVRKLEMCVVERRAPAYPIKVYKDGGILIKCSGFRYIYYSSMTKTTREVNTYSSSNTYFSNAILHTPSFVSLKNFGLNVSTF